MDKNHGEGASIATPFYHITLSILDWIFLSEFDFAKKTSGGFNLLVMPY